MPAPTQIPNVHLMTVFATEEQIGLQPVFDHLRRAPFAAHQRVETEVPPEIVMQELRAAVHLPLAQDLERLAIEHEDATRAVAIGCAERADVDPLRPTMNRVWTRIICTRKNFFRLEHFDDLRFPRIRLCVDDVNTRRADPRDDQVAPFDVRVRGIRAKRRAARVPTEVMQLIAKVRQLHFADALSVRSRLRINSDDQERVVQFAAGWIQRRDERVFFHRRLHRKPWRRIKRRVWPQEWHDRFSAWTLIFNTTRDAKSQARLSGHSPNQSAR